MNSGGVGFRPGVGGGSLQVLGRAVLQNRRECVQKVLHNALAVGAGARQVDALQHLVKVVLAAKDLGQQRLDAVVVVSQQGQAPFRAGIVQGGVVN